MSFNKISVNKDFNPVIFKNIICAYVKNIHKGTNECFIQLIPIM